MKNLNAISLKLFFGFLLLYVLIPSLRVIFKYGPGEFWLIFIIYSVVMLAFFYQLIIKNKFEWARKVLGNPFAITFIILAILVCTWYVYPIADGLKNVMHGTDQDDCIIMGATKLANLVHPYMEKTYHGNPCSPGPGILILYMPFVLTNTYPLGGVFAIIAVGLCLYLQSRKLDDVGIFLALLFSCLLISEMLAVGGDLVLLGSGIVILSFTLIKTINLKNWTQLFLLSLLCGLLASSRVNFMVIVPLASILIFLHWRKGAVYFFLSALLIATTPSLIIYFMSPNEFTPFHLIGKAQRLVPTSFIEVAFVVSVITFLYGIFIVRRNLNHLPLAIFISIAPSLIAVSLGDLLVIRLGDISQWEGANYFIALVPLASALIATLKPYAEADSKSALL